jgi:hypothetical protein
LNAKERFAKLIDVKSIVTFAIVGTIVYLSVMGAIQPADVVNMGYMILGFYFGVKLTESKI